MEISQFPIAKFLQHVLEARFPTGGNFNGSRSGDNRSLATVSKSWDNDWKVQFRLFGRPTFNPLKKYLVCHLPLLQVTFHRPPLPDPNCSNLSLEGYYWYWWTLILPHILTRSDIEGVPQLSVKCLCVCVDGGGGIRDLPIQPMKTK